MSTEEKPRPSGRGDVTIYHGGRHMIETPTLAPPAMHTSIQDLIKAASVVFGHTQDDIVGKRRQRAIIRARFAVCWLAVHGLKVSLSRVGKALGRDHSCAINAVNVAGREMYANSVYRDQIERTWRMAITREYRAALRQAVMRDDEPEIDLPPLAAVEPSNAIDWSTIEINEPGLGQWRYSQLADMNQRFIDAMDRHADGLTYCR